MREMRETLCLSQPSSTDILGALPREAKTLETHKTGIVMSIARTRYQRHRNSDGERQIYQSEILRDGAGLVWPMCGRKSVV